MLKGDSGYFLQVLLHSSFTPLRTLPSPSQPYPAGSPCFCTKSRGCDILFTAKSQPGECQNKLSESGTVSDIKLLIGLLVRSLAFPTPFHSHTHQHYFSSADTFRDRLLTIFDFTISALLPSPLCACVQGKQSSFCPPCQGIVSN